MNSEGHGNDGSALSGDGTPALEIGTALGQTPASGRPPARKRTSTLQGAAPPGEDTPSLSTSPDAPPSLEALDSAMGYGSDGASNKPGFSAVTAPASVPAPPSARGPLSAPPAPPRPRSGPPSAANPTSNPPAASVPQAPVDPLATAGGPPPIPDIDEPAPAANARDSNSASGAARRRSRRTLKIPNDAVPSTTPAPPAVAQVAPAAPPSAAREPVAPQAAIAPASNAPSTPMPAILVPPSTERVPTAQPSAPVAQPAMSSPAPHVMERGPIVTDDSIAIIRPIAILAIGDPEPMPPVAPAPVAAPPPTVVRELAPEPVPAGSGETTMPSAPSPLAAASGLRPSADALAARAAAAAPPLPPVIAPAVDLESTLPSGPSPLRAAEAAAAAAAARTEAATAKTEAATEPPVTEEVEAIEEIEPDRDSGPPSEKNALAKKADDEPLEEIEPAEEEVERLGSTEEIPIVEVVEPEQPKRPPPPPKRPEGAQAGPASTPAAPSSPPQTPPSPPVSAKPAASPPSKPAPPTAKPETKKRAWWEEIFSEDFVRTMDQPKLSHVQREVNFIEESLGVEKGAVVLDLACGTGTHAVELASRGYSVVGFDLSLAMLARASDEAQGRGQKLNFLQGDMREMAFEEMFDGIYCWSTSFGYFDEEKNLEVLARTHRALRHGGMLLIDIINRDFVAPRQPSLVWFEGDGCVCMDEMFVDFFTSRLKVKRTVMFEDGRTREVDYSIRLYNLHEIGKMMHDCGFRVVQVTGQPAHPGVFFGSESPRIIILAERAD